ncbi:ABC transporter substrate-binding protein [Rhodoplanes sp. Z2-YC6860]|uniref:ABC transporter substrate-binding protein n=1 Tax=Rhodoplanes sp. Z2-YC6860 TaxID=674703 RepID=UPI00078BC6F9|nr:ABC transporter substrate-binding protein [Rhodoplanes sp. Z2-YC6860]AMN44674.1 ABC transporter substrate-binding protein [Rhodoplanes sp. Z2-YC6860]
MKAFRRIWLVCAVLPLLSSAATAEDKLKVSIGQMDTWVNQAPVLGQRAGIFKKHGIELENFATQGSGETLQAVLSNAAQIGVGVGTIGVLRAYSRGAPVRIFGASFTGVGDLYWYVRANSPIKTLADATASTTIAFSSNGSSVHNVVLGFTSQGVKAKPVQTGGLPATLTQVLSGQIDVGWATPPFGLKEAAEGTIRIIANGNDVPSLRDQTVRVEIVHDSVANNPDLMKRLMAAYRESLAYLMTNPEATRLYAEQARVPESLMTGAIEKFRLREGKQLDKVTGLDAIMDDGVKFKFLDNPLSQDQINKLILPPG